MNNSSSTRSDLDQLRRPGWLLTASAVVFAAVAAAVRCEVAYRAFPAASL